MLTPRLRIGIAAVAAAALVGGCTSTTSDTESTTTSPTAAPSEELSPPQVPGVPLPGDAVDNAVAKLDGIAEELMSDSGIPGMAVAVVHGGDVVYTKGCGVREAGTDERVDADTVFQLASVSKSLGATVVARQVGMGTLAWDTPVRQHLPWFELSDPAVNAQLTIGDLYAHRSGLPDHATPPGLFRLHAKHVTTTMADDLAADGPYSIEDVPWTMYYLGSYALHAAFWHDRFGHPRSHGCVNLAPRDARWLFFWTLPELPSAWHGVLADVGKGTTILLDSAVSYPIEHGG